MSAQIIPFDRNAPTTTKPSTRPKNKGTKSRKAKAKPMSEEERTRLKNLFGMAARAMDEIGKGFPEGSQERAYMKVADSMLKEVFFVAYDRLCPEPEPK